MPPHLHTTLHLNHYFFGQCTANHSNTHRKHTLAKRIEYILEGNLLEKCKTAILFLCFHTAGVLHIFMLFNLLGPGTSFYRKSKINIKRKPNYEIGWFHN